MLLVWTHILAWKNCFVFLMIKKRSQILTLLLVPNPSFNVSANLRKLLKFKSFIAFELQEVFK